MIQSRALPVDFHCLIHRIMSVFSLMAALCWLASPATAGEAKPGISTSYSLTVAGIGFAKINMGSIWENGTYEVQIAAERSQLGYLVDFGGLTISRGVMSGREVVPRSFSIDYHIMQKKQHISLGFDSGRVNALDVRPPLDAMNERVPVTGKHQRGVFDPVSAFVIPLPAGALTGARACNRTLPIYDGRYRFDIKLDFIRTETVPSHDAPGKMTLAYVCGMKYKPVAGHKKHRQSDIYEWANRDGVEVWLMPLRRMDVLLPVRGVFPTPVGRAIFHITRLEMAGEVRHAAVQ